MKEITFLILFTIGTTSCFAQESFKKYYYTPQTITFKNGDKLELTKEIEIKYENMTQAQKDSIIAKYPLGSEISYNVERTINSEKVNASEKIKISEDFYKKLAIKKTEKVKSNDNIKAFVKFSESKLIVNPYLKLKSDGTFEKREIYQYILKNRQTVKLSFAEYTVSALTIPLKYRFKDHDENLKEDFSSAINLNLFVGKAWGKTSFHYREKLDNVTNTWKFTVGLLFGASTVTLNSKNTSLATIPLPADTEVIKGLGSIGVGTTYAFNKINIGAFYGYDYAIGDDADKWNYNKKPWLGIAIGYSLFNF